MECASSIAIISVQLDVLFDPFSYPENHCHTGKHINKSYQHVFLLKFGLYGPIRGNLGNERIFDENKR